jgi:hypothetical protein
MAMAARKRGRNFQPGYDTIISIGAYNQRPDQASKKQGPNTMKRYLPILIVLLFFGCADAPWYLTKKYGEILGTEEIRDHFGLNAELAKETGEAEKISHLRTKKHYRGTRIMWKVMGTAAEGQPTPDAVMILIYPYPRNPLLDKPISNEKLESLKGIAVPELGKYAYAYTSHEGAVRTRTVSFWKKAEKTLLGRLMEQLDKKRKETLRGHAVTIQVYLNGLEGQTSEHYLSVENAIGLSNLIRERM